MNNKYELSSCLIQAVIKNDVKKVSHLLNQGADPNSAVDHANVTPLHYAAQNNALEVIPLLVEAGATLDAETEPDGYTATKIAILHGNDRIAQTLIAYINDLDTRPH